MDLIIELVVFVIRALLGKDDSRKGGARDIRPIQEQVAQATAARAQVMRDKAASQEPVYDDGGWRRVLLLAAFLVLLAMGAVWFVYVRGWLPTG